jgi:epoxyqueuosine reductase
MAAGPGREPVSRPRLGTAAKAAIRDRALEAGFDAVGFADAAHGAGAELAEYLAQGYHGDMGWLAGTAEHRASPTSLWPDAKGIVALAANYGPEGNPLDGQDDPGQGAISVYARGRDYHDVLKKRLRVLAGWLHRTYDSEVKLFVDTAPVMEKPIAEQAGLGWQGKHTNLVSRRFGSWLFLAEIYTAIAFEPDVPGGDLCGSCRRCLDACPTNAFPAPHQLDARRCISYLTIEHNGHIDAELRPLMGNRIYGCDDCLAVCPWNKFATPSSIEEFQPRPGLGAPQLAELAALDDAEFRLKFSGSPIKRSGRDRIVRNVLIAIGNSADTANAPAAERLLDDVSPLVRAMAIWALAQLIDAGRFQSLRARHLPHESDPAVRDEWNDAVA